jgi:hypothetical protein
MDNRRKWRRRFFWAGVAVFVVTTTLGMIAYFMAQRVEPMLREQTAEYLRKRFGSDLDWTRFRVRLSLDSPLRALLEKGKGAIVRTEVAGIVLRHRGRTDIPPLVVMERLSFEADLSEVMQKPAHIRSVVVDGLHLTIPPKGERPKFSGTKNSSEPDEREQPPETMEDAGLAQQEAEARASVIVDQVRADGTVLRILPKDPQKDPMEFNIHQLQLTDAGPGLPFQYTAVLDNALPPGRINSTGSFGPFKASEPGDSPLQGDYVFRDADLSVFKGIAGILSSSGTFQGHLNSITVDGETDVPDFSLDSSGNQMPLHTRFHAFVDGTNGDTLLQPVEATLNESSFTAHGSVTREPGDPARTIRFNVDMQQARLEDLLMLVVKGDKPILEGGLNLKSVFELQPKDGDLADRLLMDGDFELTAAQFTSPDVQEKIDTLSRRGQGKPNQKAIENVPSDFVGKFRLADGLFALSDLQFDVPGALVNLNGTYQFGSEALDFRGQLRLQARLSKTMTGWKRILLTPVDPFFAKEGYGVVLNIKVGGTRNNPEFGLDRGSKDQEKKETSSTQKPQ